MDEPHWYVALLVFDCVIAGETQPEPEVQLRLVVAPDPESAYERALEIGRQRQHSYSNSEGETVSWQFRGLRDLDELVDGTPGDGSEVFSFRPSISASELIQPKDSLSVFWFEANKDKTAEEILEGK